ncbi:MAG: glycoside hydrolase family 3 N-terminal domain-containing protein [Elusimicrobiota bacterium]
MSRCALLAALLLPLSASAAPDSLDREVARMLLVGTRGFRVEAGDAFEHLICGVKVGGLLFFDSDSTANGAPRNIHGREQISELTKDLQALAKKCGDAPLLIAADVEGGVVNRLSMLPEVRWTKRRDVLGKGSPRGTYLEAKKIGKAMRETGLNWNLAPVVDLNLNPDSPAIGRWGRSFSDDPITVTRHAEAFIEALRSNGILNCIKHFPGHGSSAGDSHLGAVDVTKTADLRLELRPYERLIDRGVVDCVMTAHIYNRNLDPNHIITFSSAAIIGILRDEMGFDGVVVSDDLQMKAVTRRTSVERAAVLAILAGTDIVTISNNLSRFDGSLVTRVHKAIVGAVKRGTIPRERIREANRRILALKARVAR